ncbi:polysaccharide pyruvyl transferase family protein [Cryobacterium sp. 1639]|uniref:polysaccharide pyruvyl transferase family protein n=1 Tax=Cryobacterium inferilacus TaxID=2866629 RepID=UPI001C73C7E1|nr:polysaccharide pyruvyl transferase family protein [Cryobacterium sp. 1639]MBX0301727.1 polysaccharide pyruvyl transferase family protein [Cryobacterium sp. 1639]
MTVDIRGVNTHNKGAELMMMAVAARLGEEFQLSVSPNGSRYPVRARLGLKQTLLLNQAPITSAFASDRLPRSIRNAFGLTSDSEISGVLDASGFAYSDSFSTRRSDREARHANRWHRRGTPIVFLPQAFGPFDKKEQRVSSAKLLSHATIVFARDKVSLDHIRSLSSRIPVQLSPDFTVGLKTTDIPSPIDGEFAAIVPNSKMVSHTKLGLDEYLDTLIIAGRTAQSAGIEPVVVIHEFSDMQLGERIAEALSCRLFAHADPLVLKRVLGDATIAVASRFHAIVGALSQGTPVLAYGWSHKYGELLSDFGVPQWQFHGDEDMRRAVESLLVDATGKDTVRASAVEIVAKNSAMWSTVVDILKASPKPA